MEYRQYRNTDLRTSLLGMGCMRLPRIPGQGDAVDYAKSEEIIDYAYAHGVNYFDTAYVYHGGESERVIGKALSKYPRESYNLVTKLPGWLCSSKEDVLRIFHEQLDRCGVEYFDFYLCHNINEGSVASYTNDYLIPTLEQLKAEGKIRRLGFSSHSKPELLEKFASLRDWDFAQIQLNYLDWSYQNAKRQYEILTEKGIPVMVMEPVRGGRLASLCPEADELFKEYAPDRSIASWAIRFAATRPNVQVVLSGMSTMEQVIDNVATISAFTPVSDAEQDIIDKAVDILKSKTLIPCTGCRYCCGGCPMGLDIPSLLSAYNSYQLSRNKMDLIRTEELPDEQQPKSCIGCGQCTASCPQNLDVPGYMSELADLLKDMPPAPAGRPPKAKKA